MTAHHLWQRLITSTGVEGRAVVSLLVDGATGLPSNSGGSWDAALDQVTAGLDVAEGRVGDCAGLVEVWVAGNNSSAVVVNSTFADNVATIEGGAIGRVETSTVSVQNSIFGNDLPAEFQDTYSGAANHLGVDPLFVDPSARDYRLLPSSPCIDRGDAGLLPPDAADIDGDGDTTEPLPWDLDGRPRIAGVELDIGAYEYQ
ncbi:MAG: hypothetical protein JW751_16325 [Polyangiaceae bacterium]|nr:hypothetical protein [Polyangiaceae bacterium]